MEMDALLFRRATDGHADFSFSNARMD